MEDEEWDILRHYHPDRFDGRAVTSSTYKVSATYLDGFKTSAQLTIIGFEAVAKARRTAQAVQET